MILIIFIAIIALWILGGQIKGRIRDIGVPILMGIGIWLATKSWLVGLVSIGLWQIVRLGYGNYEEGEKNSFLGDLLKDKQGAVVRAVYGLIVALAGCSALIWLKFLPLPKAIAYIAGNALLGFLVSRLHLQVILADICIAGGLGSILFLL